MRRKRKSSSPAPRSQELYNVPQSTQRMRYTLLEYVLGAEIQTKVLRVFLLAIHCHLYSFSLRFFISSSSRNLLQFL